MKHTLTPTFKNAGSKKLAFFKNKVAELLPVGKGGNLVVARHNGLTDKEIQELQEYIK